jgi:hypothetical protein
MAVPSPKALAGEQAPRVTLRGAPRQILSRLLGLLGKREASWIIGAA